MKNFLKDGFSLNEFKVSSLIVVLILFSAIGIYFLFSDGDIPVNFISFLNTLVITIGGVNVVTSALDNFGKSKGEDE